MRTANRLLAVIVAAALIVAALIVIIEVVAQLLDADPVVIDWTASYRWARRTTWASTAVRVVAVLLVLAGLALLIAQLLPRRPARLAVRTAEGATDAAITRRGLANTLSDAVSHVDGVGAVRVAVRRQRVRIRATPRPGLVTESTRDDVTRVAQHRLDELDLSRPPRLAVNLRS